MRVDYYHTGNDHEERFTPSVTGKMDALFRREMTRDQQVLDTGSHAEIVGAFEGVDYEARGYYRPQSDCIMSSRDPVGFCAVCRRAIEQILDLYSKASSA